VAAHPAGQSIITSGAGILTRRRNYVIGRLQSSIFLKKMISRKGAKSAKEKRTNLFSSFAIFAPLRAKKIS
jgi:hypothetical protein